MTTKEPAPKPGKRGGGRPGRTWRTRKSAVKRQQIIDATLKCFLTLGYHRTTMVEIAKTAGATRGSIQYYFPTVQDILRETIRYVHAAWLEDFAREIRPAGEAGDVNAEGIALSWRVVQQPLHAIWQGIQAAARTDPELGQLIEGMLPELEAARRRCVREAYPALFELGNGKFDLINDFSTVFLEGLSIAKFAHRDQGRKDELLQLLVRFLRQYWAELGFRDGSATETAGADSRVREALKMLRKAERLLAADSAK